MTEVTVIEMPVKGRQSHSMTLSEQAIFDAYDVYYLDDPALFDEDLRTKMMIFSQVNLGEASEAQERDFQHLIDELSYQVINLNDVNWEAYLNSFWHFYEKNPYGLKSSQTQIIASLMHVAADYLQSVEEVDRHYAPEDIMTILSAAISIVKNLNLAWLKENLQPYMEKDVIQVYRLTGMIEDLVIDEMLDQLDPDAIEAIFLN